MRRERWVLVLILLLAGALRLNGIGQSSFDLDELSSLESSTGRDLAHMVLTLNVPVPMTALTSLDDAPPPWKIWTGMRLDNHPPLFFLLLRFWRDLIGDGEVASRLLSMIPSLTAIVLLYLAVRELDPDRPAAALWAAALMAVAPVQIHFGQYVRGYSLLEAFGTGALLATVRIERRGGSVGRFVALAACSLGMVMTHYFGIGALLAVGLYAVMKFSGRKRWQTLATLALACLVFAIIWGPFLWQQRQNFSANNQWQFEPAEGHVVRTLSRAGDLPLRWFMEPGGNFPGLASIAIVFYGLPLLFLAKRPQLLLVYCWMLVPSLVVISFDLIKSSTLTQETRYSIVAMPGAYALVAMLVADRGVWLRHLVPGAVVIACLTQVSKIYSTDRDFQKLANGLQSVVTPSDAVVFSGTGTDEWHANVLYLVVSNYAPQLPSPCVLLTQAPSADLEKWLRTRRHIWPVRIPGDAVIPLPGEVTESRRSLP